MRSLAVLALMLVAFPLASAAASGSGTLSLSTGAGTFYVRQEGAAVSVWQETNGLPGLQQSCEDAACEAPDSRMS